jgi:tRNA threonylcarbamoyladenosine biosynthesis protein TsaB
MYILAIDTTGPLGSAALLNLDNEKVLMKVSREEKGHLKNLMPLVDELLKEEQITPKDIAAVAASVGPGSYTGIRIGVSSARAFAQALDVPCIRVGSLDMFAQKAVSRDTAVIFNARRGQVYGAVYRAGGETVMRPCPCMLEDVYNCVKENQLNPVWYGDGIDAYQGSEKYGKYLEGAECSPEEERYQTAEMTALEALKLYRAGKTCRVDELLPDYMRKTEAEQKLQDGSLERARAAKLAKFRSR